MSSSELTPLHAPVNTSNDAPLVCAALETEPGQGAETTKSTHSVEETTAHNASPDLFVSLLYYVFWASMSICISLFNKHLYQGPFPFPLTLTSLHMGFAALVTAMLRGVGRIDVPIFSWGKYLTAVVPIGALYAMSLAFSNLAAQRLSVPFVQMCKAFTPVVTLAAGVQMGVEKPTLQLGVIVALFSTSVALSSLGELNFELFGFLFQITAVICEATRLVVMQYLLQVHLPEKPNPLVSLSLFTPVSFALLFPIAVVVEPFALPTLLSSKSAEFLVALNIGVAFLLNISVVLLIGRSSGLAFVFAGIVKDIVLVGSSVLIFGSPITYQQVFGYFCCLLGLNMNSVYRGKEVNVTLYGLFINAATNPQMGLIGVSMMFLLLLAQPK